MGNALRLGIARVGLAINKWRTDRKQSKRQITILILGLQGTGKSTVALRLSKPRKTLPDPTYVQTKGFNTYEIRKKKLTIRLHDIGGHPSIRELWTHYYADAHGIIYVVDSTKPDDLAEAGEVLAEVLRDERMRRKPVLLLANKQDDPNAVSEIELTRSMDLVTIVNSVRCLTRIDICAANNLKMDQGIFNGFNWLLSYIEIHYSELNDRVKEESAIDMEREKALFNLRRSARDSASPLPPTQTNGSLANTNQRAGSQEEEDDEDGIDQVQKPGELCSIDIETDTGDHIARTKPKSAILERQSPEGAADSTEDLKKHPHDTKPSSVTGLSSAIPNFSANDNTTTANTASSQSVNANPQPLSAKPDKSESSLSSVSENRKESSASLLKSAKRRNRVGPILVTDGEITEKPMSRSDPLPKQVPQTLGVDNPAFEPNIDDQDTHILLNNPPVSKKIPVSQIPVRSSAFSIRSNSTETDVDGPGEIIMVTTKAEVHKSQEAFEDINSNPTSARPPSNVDKSVTETFNFINPENTHEQNQSPTLSYLSGGQISHKTSLESINSDTQPPHYRIDQPLATQKSSNHRTTNNNNHNYNNKPLSRSSSASHLNEFSHLQAQSSPIANNPQSAQHQQLMPLQKLSSNQKHRSNKPQSSTTEHTNGNLPSAIPAHQSNGVVAKNSNR